MQKCKNIQKNSPAPAITKKKQNRVGWSQAWHTKLSITHSFFELQTPDFAWKFV